jgi:hypothetical protein
MKQTMKKRNRWQTRRYHKRLIKGGYMEKTTKNSHACREALEEVTRQLTRTQRLLTTVEKEIEKKCEVINPYELPETVWKRQ